MRYRILLLCAAAVLACAGCSDTTVIVQDRDPGLAEVGIDPGDTEFTITIPTAGPPGQTLPGPFVIEGTSIAYDDGIGALTVDLTVTNASRVAYPLPVRLEFVLLLPDGMTVLNPDNGEHGEGARVEFHFTNRDLEWSPGETSQPRTVQFGVAPGVSVGFGARILVGPDTALGTIGGVVWHDADMDGERDPGEAGVPGREIRVAWSDSLYDCIPEIDCRFIESTVTGEDGAYAFDGLKAGFYTVSIVRDRCSTHTTPIELQVILVNDNGEVTGVTGIDFGVVPVRGCNCAVVNGHFSEGEAYWINADSGPGAGSGVAEVVDVDGRRHVLRLDSRDGNDYELVRFQRNGSCGVLDWRLSWDWKAADVESGTGAIEVQVLLQDGADGPILPPIVHRQAGDSPFAWTTAEIVFDQAFFETVGLDPRRVAVMTFSLHSINVDGTGVDAYFDNIVYEPVVTADR